MLLNFFGMMCGVLVSFVLASAERNKRDARPHGLALSMAGHATMSAAGTLALLLFAWVALHNLGYLPEPAL
jgi:hypothetical protein